MNSLRNENYLLGAVIGFKIYGNSTTKFKHMESISQAELENRKLERKLFDYVKNGVYHNEKYCKATIEFIEHLVEDLEWNNEDDYNEIVDIHSKLKDRYKRKFE